MISTVDIILYTDFVYLTAGAVHTYGACGGPDGVILVNYCQ